MFSFPKLLNISFHSLIAVFISEVTNLFFVDLENKTSIELSCLEIKNENM